MLFVVTKKRVFLAVFLYVLVPLVVGAIVHYLDFSRYVTNYTRSMPLGFYKKLPLKKVQVGDIVVICPKRTEVIEEGISRGYLTLTSIPDAECPFIPLLKRIVAGVGDCVDISFAGVVVNGEMQVNSMPRKTDRYGLPMPKLQLRKCLSEGQYIALTPVKVGYDSRYLGIFTDKEIIAKVTPFLTLDINYD